MVEENEDHLGGDEEESEETDDMEEERGRKQKRDSVNYGT